MHSGDTEGGVTEQRTLWRSIACSLWLLVSILEHVQSALPPAPRSQHLPVATNLDQCLSLHLFGTYI